jgi:hypothetical protein
MNTRDRSGATPQQEKRPPYKNPIDTSNEPIVMTPTLRKRLSKTGEYTRQDGIRLVHYAGPRGALYTAYRWPSGRVQWYRMKVVSLRLRASAAGRGSVPGGGDGEEDWLF